MHKLSAIRLLILALLIGVMLPLYASESVTLGASASNAPSGSTTAVDVTVEGGSDVGAIDMALRFDPTVIRYRTIETGPAARSSLMEANEIEPGRVLVALVSSEGLVSDGLLVQLGFEVVGNKGDKSAISIESANAYHFEKLIDLPLKPIDGELVVTAELPMMYIAMGVAVVLVLVVILVFWRRRTKIKAAV